MRWATADGLYLSLRIDQIGSAQLSIIIASLDRHDCARPQRVGALRTGIHKRTAGTVLNDELVAIDFGDLAFDRDDAAGLRQSMNRGRYGWRHLHAGTGHGYCASATGGAQYQERGGASCNLGPA
jgi:hypothetical protein